MKATTIPVVLGALGLIKKGLEKYIQQISGNIKTHGQQKVTVLGTSKKDTLALGPGIGLGYSVYYLIIIRRRRS